MSVPLHVRVLLVEDSPTDVKLVEGFCATVGQRRFDLIHVDSLSAALSRVRDEAFDVILLDLGLPDSFGLMTLDSLLMDCDGIPVIVLTAQAEEKIAIAAVQRGAQDFLAKGDFDAQLLWRSIRYAVERNELQRSRRELERALLNVLGEEQQRIGRELHDSVGQGLSGLNLMATSLANKLADRKEPEAETAAEIAVGVQEVLNEFRVVLRGLVPVDLETDGLPVALERLCQAASKRSSIPCQLRCSDTISVNDNSIATHLYRIAQESLNNALKHSNATRVVLQLGRSTKGLILTVRDNGSGFQPDVVDAKSMGLRIMQHRCGLIDGTLSVKSSPGQGCVIQCAVSIPNS